MVNNFVYTCDFCKKDANGPLRIGLTVDPVPKHFCNAKCFVSYCDLHKRLQNTLAYAMYKDLVTFEESNSTESNIPHDGEESHDT